MQNIMNNDANDELEILYNNALQFSKSHYENFPVVSFFIKKDMRKHVATVYQFARQADDLADEGNSSPEERIDEIDKYRAKLNNSVKNEDNEGFWKILRYTILTNNLNPSNFFNLLEAFNQDVWKNRYEDFDELLHYCNNSANPVGRIILELHNIHKELPNSYSDKICTALQLTNFYQDISLDIEKGRIYIPLSEMNIFNVSESDIENRKYTESFVNLMRYQVERTKKLFNEGRNLLKYLPTKLKFQILVTIKGGEAILSKIEEMNYYVLDKRPTLSKMEFIKLFISAIIWRK